MADSTADTTPPPSDEDVLHSMRELVQDLERWPGAEHPAVPSPTRSDAGHRPSGERLGALAMATCGVVLLIAAALMPSCSSQAAPASTPHHVTAP